MPTRQVHILRCGGSQAAVVWDVITTLHRHEKDDLSVVVWDDGHGDVHPMLQKLPRARSFQECLAFIGDKASENVSLTKEVTKNDVKVYICHGNSNVRMKLHAEILDLLPLACFPTVISPTAKISRSSQISKAGTFVGENAVVLTNASIQEFCIVAAASVVSHDVKIGPYCNINPGSVICGFGIVQRGSTVGANACVRDHIEIANNTAVGMQAGVVSSIRTPGKIYTGVPAKEKSLKICDKTTARVGKNIINIPWCTNKTFNTERFQQYLQPSISSGHMTNNGPLQNVLCQKIKNICKSQKHVVMAASGTAALHTLVCALQIREKRQLRWATQSFTFPSAIQGPLSHAIIFDIDKELGGPCMRQLQENLKNIDGVVITNPFGLQTSVEDYELWCKDHGKLLLFDNASTPIGTVGDGRSICDIGDGAIISLHETKPLGRGEGGAIFISSDLQQYVHQAMNFGFDFHRPEGDIPHRFASNWKMSDIAAAAICDHLDSVLESNWFGKLEDLTHHAVTVISSHGLVFGHTLVFPTLLPCLFLKLPKGRKFEVGAICSYLKRCIPSIEAKSYYRPLGTRQETPLAWNHFDHSVCLPLHIGVSKEMITYEVEQLIQACSLFELVDETSKQRKTQH